MIDLQAKHALFDGFAQVGRAVASGPRIEILDVLANGERSVESLADQVGLSVANTSQHLQVLKRAGLVEPRREGTFVYYRLASEEVFEFLRALRALSSARVAEVDRLAAAYLGARDEREPIRRERLAERLEAGDVLVLDVRPNEEFAAGHLPGAVSAPVDELPQRIRDFPSDREIVVYCRGPYCAFSDEAVELLRKEGFRARRLEDGLPEWRAARLPVARD